MKWMNHFVKFFQLTESIKYMWQKIAVDAIINGHLVIINGTQQNVKY